MRLKIIGLFAALLLVAACQTAPEDTASSGGEGGAGDGGAAATVDSADTGDVAAADIDIGPEPGSVDDFIATVGYLVFFDFDKSNLKADARETLDRQAAWLLTYTSETVTIEGHCDERGTREYNLALGERRAQSVKDYLVAMGVDSSRISTLSYGKERPYAIGHNEDAWAQNRRGVTSLN